MSNATPQPVPFEILERPGQPSIGTNGAVRVQVLDQQGHMFKRRGIAGINARPPGESVLPHLNALAGELLGQLDMPADELRRRLLALAALAEPKEPRRIEWLVAELNGVRVYVDGADVVVTTMDLSL